MSSGYYQIWSWRLDWTKEELKSIDIKARKLMTMNGSLHPKGNVGRLYLTGKEGGGEPISCEECLNVEVQNLDKHLSESEEWMSKFAAGKRGCQKWKFRMYLKSV